MERSLARLRPFAHPKEAGRRWVALLLVLILPALVASPLRAQFSQNLINHEPGGEADRFHPALHRLLDGRYLLLWADLSRGSEDISSCLLSPSLERITPPERANADASFTLHDAPLLSTSGGGRVVALWINNHGGYADLAAQSYSDSTGAALGPERLVNGIQGIGVVQSPAAATDDQGVTLVCWMDNRVNQYRVMAQRLDRNGTHLETNIAAVPEHATQIQRHPAVAVRPGGGWAMAWDEPGVGIGRVYCRFLSAAGAPEDGIFSPGGEGFDQRNPAVLVRQTDVLLVWVDNREGEHDLWGQWFGLTGVPLTQPAAMQAVSTTGPEANPALVALPGNGFALLWSGAVGSRERTMIRVFAGDGTPLGPERPMRDPPEGVLMGEGSVAPADSGRVALAWNDDWSLSEQVYLERFDPAQGALPPVRQVYFQNQSAHQILPDVALLPGGRAVVVWGDAREGDYVIYGQFIELSGEPAPTSEFRISTIPTHARYLTENTPEDLRQMAPHVAASPLGTFVVTWTGDIGGGKLGAYGQLFDNEGQAIGSNFEIPQAAPGALRSPQFDPTPAMGSDGRFAIAWRDDSYESGGDIYLQRYRASGDTLGRPILVNNSAYRNSPQQNPDLAMTPFNEMVVTWIDGRGGGWDIYRQRLGPAGNRLDTPDDVEVNIPDSPTENQFYPAVASNGNAIAEVWEDMPLTAGYIRGRLDFLESAAGQAAGAPAAGALRPAPPVEFTVNPLRHPAGIKRPRVAMDSSGRFVVTWWDLFEGTTEVWAQRYNADGSTDGAAYRISEGESVGHRMLVRVAANGSRIQYVWTDSRRLRGWDVYARRVNWFYDGETTPVALRSMDAAATSAGIELSWSVPLDQTAPAFRIWRDLADAAAPRAQPSPEAVLLTPDGIEPIEGGDYRYLDRQAPAGTPLAYYLERLAPGGGSEFFGPLRAQLDPPAEAAWKMEPNPFQGQIRFLRPVPGPARLTVWDAAGRRLRVLRREEGSAEPLLWDGRDQAGHPVPAGCYLVRPESPGSGGGPDRAVLRVVRIR